MSFRVFKSLLVVGFVSAMLAAGSARAAGGNSQGAGGNGQGAGGNGQGGNNNSQGRAVPEFDATSVGSIAALVAAGGLLIARRRAKH